jgi:hypothetical protein
MAQEIREKLIYSLKKSGLGHLAYSHQFELILSHSRQ